MQIRQINRDPFPEAERGTLEFAASCTFMTVGVQIELTVAEAKELLDVLENWPPVGKITLQMEKDLRACIGHVNVSDQGRCPGCGCLLLGGAHAPNCVTVRAGGSAGVR